MTSPQSHLILNPNFTQHRTHTTKSLMHPSNSDSKSKTSRAEQKQLGSPPTTTIKHPTHKALTFSNIRYNAHKLNNSQLLFNLVLKGNKKKNEEKPPVRKPQSLRSARSDNTDKRVERTHREIEREGREKREREL